MALSTIGTNQIASAAVGTNQIASGSVDTSQIASGAVGTSQIASEAVTVPKVADQVLASRNLVINGSCQIHQRGGTTGITNANSGYYGPDRFKFNEDGTMTAVVSIERETLTSGNAFNDGNLYAYKLTGLELTNAK